MAEGIHAQAGNEIEILLALEVIQENSLSFFKGNGISVVGGQEIALLKIDDLFQAGHI